MGNAEDYCLAGISSLHFELTVSRLFEMCEKFSVDRVTLWDLEGRPNTTAFETGAKWTDTRSVLDIEPKNASRILCLFRIVMGGIETNVGVGASRGATTFLEGPVYIDHFMSKTSDKPAALVEFAGFSLSLAKRLGCLYLGLSLENDKGLLIDPDTRVFVPCLFVIARSSDVGRIIPKSMDYSLKVEESDGYTLVWLVSPESFVSGKTCSEGSRGLAERIIRQACKNVRAA